MNILVFNVGSTTLKYACIDSVSGNRLTQGTVDRIGQMGGDSADHLSAARSTFAMHADFKIAAIAHRIVQGADRFVAPTIVDDAVLADLKSLDSLAPLHNPPARLVVEASRDHDTTIPNVLVFDSAYFATLPPKAYRYAVPENIFSQHHVRRFGAHGTSHQFVTDRAIAWLDRDDAKKNDTKRDHKHRIISLHLGGGASVTASIGGVAIETSMGMTPLEGLVMATRSGDIDPSVVFHLMRTAGMSVDDVDRLLNKQSGLSGLCGEEDMRRILTRRDEGDEAATLAIDIYVHRMQKYIGAYFAILGGLDAVLFTAGVGENSSLIRELATTSLVHLGIAIDPDLNNAKSVGRDVRDLSAAGATVRTLMVPTDEELAIAVQAAKLLIDATRVIT